MATTNLPRLAELGPDLTKVTRSQRWISIALPFACVTAYFVSAALAWWPAAILAVAGYTFVSYGSTSHDLVHGNLGLPRRLNRVLLSAIELLGLRSGSAYRLAHLHHHKRFPADDDVEAAAAHGSLLDALLAGPLHQSRIWWWALRCSRIDRKWIAIEGALCVAIVLSALVAWPWTPIPAVYVALVILGSWTFPLITAYLPHDPAGTDDLHRTRRFRGAVLDVIFGSHLYHLEHHLYPKVPHHHWPKLAKRLDPHFERAGVKPIVLGF
jgi:beta-carotene hydroxylase